MIYRVTKIRPEDKIVLDQLRTLWGKMESRVGNHPRPWIGLLRRSAMARAMRGSNSIEGYDVSPDDALAAADEEEIPFEAAAKSYRAVTCYRDAMTYVIRLWNDPHSKCDTTLIRALHYMITKYQPTKNPGVWRPGVALVRDESTGKIVYQGAPVDEVPQLMEEVAASLARPDPISRMVQAAMAHLNLAMIHPFSDGNGRMARCLQTLVMARGGVLSPVFCSIEEYLGRNTPDYYNVLAEVGEGSWRPKQNPYPWIQFVLTAQFRQAHTTLRRERDLELLWNDLENELDRRGLPDRSIAILSEASNRRRIRRSTYSLLADVSDPVSTKDLRALVKAGLLEAVGEKRGRHYVASPELMQMRTRHMNKEEIPDPYELATKTAAIGSIR